MGLDTRQMGRNMKTLITALTLSVLTASAFVQSANAQRFDSSRERAIQECMAMQKQYPTDPFGHGGAEHQYHACMANKGRMS